MSEETTKELVQYEVFNFSMDPSQIKIGPAEEVLKDMEDRFLKMQIDDFEDKENIQKVKEAKSVVVAESSGLDKMKAIAKDKPWKFCKMVDKKFNLIKPRIDTLKSHLTKEVKKIKAEEERLAAEAQRKKDAKIKARKQALIDAGAAMGLDGFTWGTPPQAIPEFTVLMSDDDKFETIVQTVACWKDEQDEIAAKAAATLKKAQDEEVERLAEQKKKDDDLRAREEKVKADEEKAEKEKQQRIKEEQQRRINACIHLGLIFDGEYYVYGDVSFHSGEMNAMNIFEFNDLIEKARKRMAEIRKQEDKEREAEKERIQKEATEKAEKAAEDKRKREADEKAEADRQAKEEAERKERLKPDKQKLLDFANILYNMGYPKVSSNEAKDIIEAVRIDLDNAAAYINNKANEL